MELILATRNKNKLKEFKEIFTEINLLSLDDIGFKGELIEDGNSFIENSLKKCLNVYNVTKLPVMADDSGLCVEALNDEPGVYSARYGGKNLTDKERYMFLLKNLEGFNNLNASFVCALVLLINPNRVYIIQEEIKGLITFQPRGENGFGYDPIFFLPEYNKTMAELPLDLKNKISHRAKASKIMKEILNNLKNDFSNCKI